MSVKFIIVTGLLFVGSLLAALYVMVFSEQFQAVTTLNNRIELLENQYAQQLENFNRFDENTQRLNSTTTPSEINSPIDGFKLNWFLKMSGGIAVPPLDALFAYIIDTAMPDNALPTIIDSIEFVTS